MHGSSVFSCKPYVGGRQCDRCAAGYYRFPNCLPCDCHKDGVTSNVCHPDTGECLCKVSSVHRLKISNPASCCFYAVFSSCLDSFCREMSLASGVMFVEKDPFILTPPTLKVAPAASALEPPTGVRAPINAEERCVLFMPLHACGCLCVVCLTELFVCD